MTETTIPEGFFPLTLGDYGFIPANGPLYGKRDNGYFLLGFRVEDRHCNPARICHGGMLMTFADMQLPLGIRLQSETDAGFMPTVHLSAEFMAPAPLGAWVEGRTDILRQTRNLAFAQCLVTADGEVVLRASGIFKLASRAEPVPLDAILLNEPGGK